MYSALDFNRNINNCFLSELEVRNMDPLRHLVAERSAHIYERNALIRNCRHSGLATWTNQHQAVQSSACK